MVWRLWTGGLEVVEGGMKDVERWSGGCGELVWRMWSGGLEVVETWSGD